MVCPMSMDGRALHPSRNRRGIPYPRISPNTRASFQRSINHRVSRTPPPANPQVKPLSRLAPFPAALEPAVCFLRTRTERRSAAAGGWARKPAVNLLVPVNLVSPIPPLCLFRQPWNRPVYLL